MTRLVRLLRKAPTRDAEDVPPSGSLPCAPSPSGRRRLRTGHLGRAPGRGTFAHPRMGGASLAGAPVGAQLVNGVHMSTDLPLFGHLSRAQTMARPASFGGRRHLPA
jgi:hypothetical protein